MKIMNAFSLNSHNPYFSRRFFAILYIAIVCFLGTFVTILILVEGSLQSAEVKADEAELSGHNPYFSRRFFAMLPDHRNETDTRQSQSLF